jgi:hypothetical protein
MNKKLMINNIHHFGCDVERCPRCGGQLAFSCCQPSGFYTEEEPEEEESEEEDTADQDEGQ